MFNPMTYAGAGVDYDVLDRFKRAAQAAALGTAENIARLNGGEFKEYAPSRGESVYLIEAAKSFYAFVEEGLGTKNLIADAMQKLTGKSYYREIGIDTAASIFNDMYTAGALPLSIAMHVAVGDSAWFKDEKRSHDLIEGWKEACDLARCTWGPGETPTLKGNINPETVVLSGSAIGLIKPKERLINQSSLWHGDAIVLVESSGVHANGMTLVREIANKLPEGYLSKLPDGSVFGEVLLEPTYIYGRLVEECLDAGVKIHYTANITGHGWRKLMRARESFAYIIERLPRQQPIFEFLQKAGPVDDREAYGNFNMGAGFAFFMPECGVDTLIRIAASLGLRAHHAGHIEHSREKKVIIEPMNLEFKGETLSVR